jgi:large subunit ribosomal protein L31
MKEKIHPNYKIIEVTCGCGEKFMCGTTKNVQSLSVEICSQCHPYFTGKQKMVDTGGRVEKFQRKFGLGLK